MLPESICSITIEPKEGNAFCSIGVTAWKKDDTQIPSFYSPYMINLYKSNGSKKEEETLHIGFADTFTRLTKGQPYAPEKVHCITDSSEYAYHIRQLFKKCVKAGYLNTQQVPNAIIGIDALQLIHCKGDFDYETYIETLKDEDHSITRIQPILHHINTYPSPREMKMSIISAHAYIKYIKQETQ